MYRHNSSSDYVSQHLYDLNSSSTQFAKFYYLNNQEIEAIRNIFEVMKDSENNISCYDFHLYFNNEAVQLFESFFKLSNDYTFTWNQFFQFMVIVLFAPQIVIFYMLLVFNSSYNGSISINDIIVLIRSINDEAVNRSDIRKIFDYLDLNKDGYLTLNQFCNFISKSIHYFENIMILREAIIDTVFPHNHIFAILKRKLYIEKIRRYKAEHGNELPPINCVSRLKMFFYNTPHPYEYNYDYNEITDNMINLHSLLCLFMRNFIPNYSFQKEIQTLPPKYLKIFKVFFIISKIDNYYIKFKEQSSVNTITSMSVLSPMSFPRKKSSSNMQNSRYNNDNDSTPIVIATSTNTGNTGNTSSTGNTSNTCNTTNTNNQKRDGKGSLISSSVSISQTRHCSILRKPSFVKKMKHRSDVTNYNTDRSRSIVKPTVDTSINKMDNSNNNNNKIGKRNSVDSNSPFILNVESRDDSPIYSFSPNLPPPSLSNITKSTSAKPNLRPTSTSLNMIQVSHSNTYLPPTYPTLRPLANSCDDAGFNTTSTNDHNNRKNLKINSNFERSNSSNSVNLPGFISPCETEENHNYYDDDDDLDMKV